MSSDLPAKIISKELKESVAVDFALMQASSAEAPVYNVRDICAMWDITLEQLEELKRDPEFIRLARCEMASLKKSGEHIAVKGRLLLEAWLDNQAASWLADSDATLSDRTKVMETIIKVSQIIKKDGGSSQDGESPTGYKPTIQINFSGVQPTSVEKVVN